MNDTLPQYSELRAFVSEWKERFGFLAVENAPDSVESIDEVASILNEIREQNARKIAALEGENARLRAALEVYSNPIHWYRHDCSKFRDWWVRNGIFDGDGYSLAEKALKGE